MGEQLWSNYVYPIVQTEMLSHYLGKNVMQLPSVA